MTRPKPWTARACVPPPRGPSRTGLSRSSIFSMPHPVGSLDEGGPNLLAGEGEREAAPGASKWPPSGSMNAIFSHTSAGRSRNVVAMVWGAGRGCGSVLCQHVAVTLPAFHFFLKKKTSCPHPHPSLPRRTHAKPGEPAPPLKGAGEDKTGRERGALRGVAVLSPRSAPPMPPSLHTPPMQGACPRCGRAK